MSATIFSFVAQDDRYLFRDWGSSPSSVTENELDLVAKHFCEVQRRGVPFLKRFLVLVYHACNPPLLGKPCASPPAWIETLFAFLKLSHLRRFRSQHPERFFFSHVFFFHSMYAIRNLAVSSSPFRQFSSSQFCCFIAV